MEIVNFKQDPLEFLTERELHSVDVLIVDLTCGRAGDRDNLWDLFLQFDRVLKLNGHLYVFCDDIVSPMLLNWVREAGDEHKFVEAQQLICLWGAYTTSEDRLYNPSYDCLVFAWRKFRREGFRHDHLVSDVLHSWGPPDGVRHLVKPLYLLRTLLEKSVRVGDIVCDPFSSQGLLGKACGGLNVTVLMNDVGGKE